MAKKQAAKRVPYRRDTSYIEKVQEILVSEGLETTLISDSGSPFDIVFSTPAGDEIGLEATFNGRFESHDVVARLLGRVSKAYGPLRIRQVVIVAQWFTEKEREILDGYHGIEVVEFHMLKQWLRRYMRAAAPVRRSTGATIKGNKERIVIAAAALASLIDDKLSELRGQKPNSVESIAARDASMAKYETLKAKVDDLRVAVERFTAGKIKEPTIARKATSFGEGVTSWWTKDHDGILSTSYGTGVFLSAVAVCSLIGVNPTFAAGIAGVLVGGKTVAGALKSLPKKLP
jgi:hypothetical protein